MSRNLVLQINSKWGNDESSAVNFEKYLNLEKQLTKQNYKQEEQIEEAMMDRKE